MPNDAWTNGAGANQGQEVGDQCDGLMGTPLGTAPDGAKYNQVINGHFYWYQEEWSNRTHSCLQRLTPAGTAARKVHGHRGRRAHVELRRPRLERVARCSPSTSGSSTTPSARRPSRDVAHDLAHLPVRGRLLRRPDHHGHDGSSAGTGGIVTTGHSGFTPGFTFAPTHPRAGGHVSFSALGTVSAQPVITYLWEFGDGTTGSGQSPTHVYASAGTYTVTLVMFSGVGSAFPGAGAGPVVHAVTDGYRVVSRGTDQAHLKEMGARVWCAISSHAAAYPEPPATREPPPGTASQPELACATPEPPACRSRPTEISQRARENQCCSTAWPTRTATG